MWITAYPNEYMVDTNFEFDFWAVGEGWAPITNWYDENFGGDNGTSYFVVLMLFILLIIGIISGLVYWRFKEKCNACFRKICKNKVGAGNESEAEASSGKHVQLSQV